MTLALLWTNYTDQIKSQSAFGSSLTSTALSKWNFGRLDQRFDIRVLGSIFWKRIIASNASGIFGIALLIYSFVLADKRIKRLLFVSLVLFVLPIFLFINLHRVHSYYQLSSTLFLIGAITIAITQIDMKNHMRKYIVPLVIIFLVSHNIYSYHTSYAKDTLQKFDLSNSRSLAVGNVIERYTDKNSGVVIFGDSWNSEIAYYSKRKAFTVPDWFKSYDSVWKAPAKYMGDLDLSAIVFIVKDNDITAIKKRPDVQKDSCLYKIYENCYIWLPGVKAILPVDGVKLKADLFTNVFSTK